MQLFKKNTNKIKVMALGGLNEIGKNMTLIEYKDEIIVIDAGLSFPEDDILKKIDVPVYGTMLSIGLIQVKLKEHKLSTAKLNVVTPRQIIKLSNMSVEFIKNNHSIPGACSIAVHTDQGIIYHTGDFKIDLTPIDGDIMDLHRICELGQRGYFYY